MPKVSFAYADKKLAFTGKNLVKSFLPQLFAEEGRTLGSLTYIFCSDEYLLQINRQFLEHDYYTDIITFDLSETKDTVDGEIYISIDRVKDNADQLKLPFKDELLRMIFHGALHLCGYKDKKKSEIEQMRNQESHYIRLYEQFSAQ